MEIPAPKPLVARLTRYFLGSVFVVAGFSKLFPLRDFLQQLLAYRFPLPDKFLYIAALIMILVEIIIGLSVLINFNLPLSLLGMQIVLVIMIPATIWGALHKAPSCGCYGNLVRRDPWTAMVEDLLMLLVSILLKPVVKKKVHDKFYILKACFVVAVTIGAFVYGMLQLSEVLAFAAKPPL